MARMPPGRLTPITSDAASGGTGGYTPALRAGDFVFVSGQGPLEPGTLAVLGQTVGEQTHHTLRNVLTLVEAAGGDAESIVRCGCYLASIDLFDEFTAAYEAFFTHQPRPTRTTIGCRLAGILVEIDCVAYVPLPADG
jgi:2-iminobutanoate/2-iminopropanoate deaminase